MDEVFSVPQTRESIYRMKKAYDAIHQHGLWHILSVRMSDYRGAYPKIFIYYYLPIVLKFYKQVCFLYFGGIFFLIRFLIMNRDFRILHHIDRYTLASVFYPRPHSHIHPI